MTNAIESYWYVYNPAGFRPRYKHATAESAISESRRLAHEHPGQRFEVLRCIGFSQVEPRPDCFKPLAVNLQDEIPF